MNKIWLVYLGYIYISTEHRSQSFLLSFASGSLEDHISSGDISNVVNNPYF